MGVLENDNAPAPKQIARNQVTMGNHSLEFWKLEVCDQAIQWPRPLLSPVLYSHDGCGGKDDGERILVFLLILLRTLKIIIGLHTHDLIPSQRSGS